MAKFIDAPGKAMIVGATRQICADLYAAIVDCAPTGTPTSSTRAASRSSTAEPRRTRQSIAVHVRRDSENKVIKERLRTVEDELEIVIVKDMMLTGYDSQPLHTLYLDRPLKGALLMQTLARVNRTFRGKQDGLLVSYAPLVDNLNARSRSTRPPTRRPRPMGRSIDEAVALTERSARRAGDADRGAGLAGSPQRATRSAGG
jgi:type I restriction enzyme R subunit